MTKCPLCEIELNERHVLNGKMLIHTESDCAMSNIYAEPKWWHRLARQVARLKKKSTGVTGKNKRRKI